ncbi:hypothetical protein C4D60_Mb09t26790 [Musa balbisiana]|uniref:Uncharacterized protein n=1 Tax=Musa balbisiana TaxID=52838 RepID=A0A4S8IK39_MUSBA|nr:hypothetical protein C4D60_Mb09t26790 [Musa balbisiana]
MGSGRSAVGEAEAASPDPVITGPTPTPLRCHPPVLALSGKKPPYPQREAANHPHLPPLRFSTLRRL